MKMIKILFICHGNICRSPMAEFVMKDMAGKAGLGDMFEVASAATSREEIGNPVYPPARRKLAENGIGCAGKKARQVTKADFDRYDMLVCMDHNNIRNLRRMFGDRAMDKVSLMLDHAGRPGEEVADPWYTGNFDATWDDVTAGCAGIIDETAPGK